MKKLAYLFIVLFTFLSCNNDDDCTTTPIETSCGPSAIITSEANYNAIQSNYYTISDVVLNGNCLAITLSASGCSS